MAIKDYIWPFIYEFIGCMALGAFIDGYKRSYVGAILLPLISFVAHAIAWTVSRAHLNPAVSLANLLRRDVKFGFGHFVVYLVAQVLGFISGIMWEWWFYQNPLRMNIWKDASNNFQYHEALAMEFFGTLAFIVVHLLSTHTSTSLSANWGLNCFVVGTFYGALVVWGFDWTGGSFNPGYGFAQNIVDLWNTGDRKSVEFLWIYV